jgi:hypothetical protein
MKYQPALQIKFVRAFGIIEPNFMKRGRTIAFVLILIVLIVLFPCSRAEAQSLSCGLSLGMPLNNLADANGSHVANTMPFTLGPSLRISLPFSLGVDLDLLYKKLEFGLTSNPASIAAHRLELAPMLRYDFTRLPIHPFLHAGMSFNWIATVSGSDSCRGALAGSDRYYCLDGEIVAEIRHSHTHGFVLGGGLDFYLAALHLTPELRFTRWVDRNFGTRDSSLRSNLNQVEFLVGILF